MSTDCVVISSSLHDLSRSSWDGLQHPSFYLSYDWLMARSITIGGPGQFLMVRDESGRPVLGFPLYTVGATSHPGYEPVGLLLSAARAAPACASAGANSLRDFCDTLERERTRLLPALVVAAPGRSGGLSYGRGITGAQAQRALETACDAVESLAVRASAPVSAWLYVPEDVDETLHRTLRGRGYVPVVMDAESYLPIAWRTFDEYLRTFTARRRKTFRQEMARFSGAGVRVDVQGVAALTRELAVLEVEWRAKYGRNVSVADVEAQYSLLKEHVGRSVRVFVARQRDRAIGFTVFFEHLDVWYSRFGGFDYRAGKVFCYFNLLFYEPVREAIRRGVTCIRYSTASVETKRRRGCLRTNVLMYVRFPADIVPRSALTVLDRRRAARMDVSL